MKIAVRAGHTPAKPGTSGLINESSEARRVTPILITYLKNLGHTVKDVTPADVAIYLNPGPHVIAKAIAEGVTGQTVDNEIMPN